MRTDADREEMRVGLVQDGLQDAERVEGAVGQGRGEAEGAVVVQVLLAEERHDDLSAGVDLAGAEADRQRVAREVD